MQILHSFVPITMAGSLVGCSVTELPPPAAPAQILPRVTNLPPPPPPGEATVVIDADHPAVVDEVTGHLAGIHGGPVTRPLCVSTPCVVNLGFGTHEVQLSVPTAPRGTLGGEGVIVVGTRPVAYRYALGEPDPDYDSREHGAIALVLGLVATPIGIGIAGRAGSASSGEEHAGIGIAIGGGILIALGAAMMSQFRHRAGTGTQWVIQ